jgi:hypothetical protein
MDEPVLSADARRLLKHFHDQRLRSMQYELPKAQEHLFADPTACERAQTELNAAGLVELGPPRPPGDTSRVRAAALTWKGTRYLKQISTISRPR